jgi:hypothetical protein
MAPGKPVYRELVLAGGSRASAGRPSRFYLNFCHTRV